jgi:hypothetical protein
MPKNIPDQFRRYAQLHLPSSMRVSQYVASEIGCRYARRSSMLNQSVPYRRRR